MFSKIQKLHCSVKIIPTNDIYDFRQVTINLVFDYFSESEFSTKMKYIGKKILQYCASLPLAVTVQAGLLARKDTIDEWETVLKNIYTYLRSGKSHGQGGMGTSWLLLLSYDCLPYYFKPYFLYLGQFPEDFEIPTNILTQLWVAKGFISMAQQRQGFVETMEEIAFSYLTELLERCMVEIGKRGFVRNIKSCRLHDLMRDMCLLQSKKESIIQIVNLSHIKDRLPFPIVTEATLTSNVRRLGIYADATVEELFPSRYGRESHLRSLYVILWILG